MVADGALRSMKPSENKRNMTGLQPVSRPVEQVALNVFLEGGGGSTFVPSLYRQTMKTGGAKNHGVITG